MNDTESLKFVMLKKLTTSSIIISSNKPVLFFMNYANENLIWVEPDIASPRIQTVQSFI